MEPSIREISVNRLFLSVTPFVLMCVLLMMMKKSLYDQLGLELSSQECEMSKHLIEDTHLRGLSMGVLPSTVLPVLYVLLLRHLTTTI